MSTLKGDIINSAYSRLRISGITKVPSPADITLALDRLEDMMASWRSWNIDLGYNFEETPNSGTPHGMARSSLAGVKSGLALILLADYGKEAPTPLILEAGAAFSQLMAAASKQSTLSYPDRMPVGSGNRTTANWQRFAPKTDIDDMDFAAEVMFVSDIKDFEENLAYALRTDNTETVASFTITADSGITIVSSSLASPIITFRIQAGDVAYDRVVLTLVALTSLGQRITKQYYFSLRGTS